ncbi:MAG: branched-chain amino acid transport system II carrier protein, partial [Firmicutes bacterium]|nr:branched-chain amino acid transport system II carrier protein [Candidatus Colimorpha enterica]
LNKIIDYSVPVLMFLYPLAITLILLGLFGNLFGHNRWVYGFVTGFTLVAAVYDFLAALPKELIVKLRLTNALAAIKNFLPLSDIGLGWVVPAAVGLVIGIAVMLFTKKKAPANA